LPVGIGRRAAVPTDGLQLPGHLTVLRGVQAGFLLGLVDTKPDEVVDDLEMMKVAMPL